MTKNKQFVLACQNGDFDQVRNLLTGKSKRYVDIHYQNDVGLSWACQNGCLDIVQYLLTSPELTEHANNARGLCYAALFGHIEVIDYLLTSPELLENGRGFADLHANDDEAFTNSCFKEQTETIKYFLYDHNLQITPSITDFLYNNNTKEYMEVVLKMVERRNLYYQLNSNTISKQAGLKLNKV